MLTDSDKERLDSIMAASIKRMEERVFPLDRDEDKIAEILSRAERAAAEEHERLVESKAGFASTVKFQTSVTDSEDNKEFPNINRYRLFEA